MLNLLSTLSLLLCLAVVVMWVGSYLPESVWMRWIDGRLVLVGADGRNARDLSQGFMAAPLSGAMGTRSLLAALRSGVAPYGRTEPAPIPPARTLLLGVEVIDVVDTLRGRREYWVLTVPAACVLVIAAVPALTLVGVLRRRRAGRSGRCRSCGYNLTGNISGVCPECGNETTTSPRSAACSTS